MFAHARAAVCRGASALAVPMALPRRHAAMIASAKVAASDVELGFVDGARATVAGVWLRDSCQCRECVHPTTLQRLVGNGEVDPQIAPMKATIAEGGGNLNLVWPDGHQTSLAASWLAKRGVGSSDKGPDVLTSDFQRSWSAEWMRSHVDEVTFDIEEVKKGGFVAHAWLYALRRYGLTRLTGAAHKRGELEDLARKIQVQLRATIYDEDGVRTFHVKTKPKAVNQAYTAAALPLHTDLTFYADPPHVQLLHCIAQDSSDGADDMAGASTFADALHAVEKMEAETPAHVQLLFKHKLKFEDVDPSEKPRFHLEAAHPVLERMATGGLVMNHNNGLKTAFLDPEMSPDTCREHFAAVSSLQKALEAEVFEYKTQPGSIWAFDNRRVLHGRRAITATKEREFEGCYMEWDDLESLLRLHTVAEDARVRVE